MNAPRNSLLNWPHQVPASALNSLADAHFIKGLELGPPQWWQMWQKTRLAELLDWAGESQKLRLWLSASAGDSSLAALPVMRREDFRALVDLQTARVPMEHGALALFHSSGSAGVPVSFWRSELATRVSVSHYWADHHRQSRNLSARMAVITGTPGAHEGEHASVSGDPWLQPGCLLARNAPQFTMLEHAHWVCEHAPVYLATTPATLSSIISIIETLRLPAPRVAQVMTSSHAVEPELRTRARQVLGASIRDRYSCEEVGPIAFQCPESDDHYHTAVGNVIVEIVDETGQLVPEGTSGNVLVTGLHQWASPAIRYALGDIATLHSHCPACGATVPALSQLLGRRFFLLHTANGGLRHVRILAEHWLACAPVREHRLVQTGPSHFRVELVLERPIAMSESRAIKDMLIRLVGSEFTFEITPMDAIPWPPSQKRHEFVGWMP